MQSCSKPGRQYSSQCVSDAELSSPVTCMGVFTADLTGVVFDASSRDIFVPTRRGLAASSLAENPFAGDFTLWGLLAADLLRSGFGRGFVVSVFMVLLIGLAVGRARRGSLAYADAGMGLGLVFFCIMRIVAQLWYRSMLIFATF